MQNVAPNLRHVFIADRGKRLAVIDLEQTEARDVGYFCGCLFDDWEFLDACESGDLHTNNAKRIWPELAWVGEAKADRRIAEGTFYREFSYRDMAKRGGHLSNYMGSAWTACRSLKVPLKYMEDFQDRYCKGEKAAFPCIPRYWQWVAQELQTTYSLTTPFGRKRHFFGRPGDNTTIREAIAYLPQSTTADRMNLGMWRVWKKMPEVQLLAQTYDSITFQFEEELDENSVITKALELIRVELTAPSGRKYIVPGEAKVGWNWGTRVTEENVERAKKEGKKPPRLNPNGLVKWRPEAKDSRQRFIGWAKG
jgi:DNA polymerase I-like protein with 3'-5' exonuclease and polymerase domains